MRDISTYLEKATEALARWDKEAFRAFLEDLRTSFPDHVIEWDEEAGEDWARLLQARSAGALLGVHVPLVIADHALEGALRMAASKREITVVGVDGLDSERLAASRESLTKAFGEQVTRMDGFDPEEFTSLDLWWATV